MASINISIPDEVLQRVVDGFTGFHNYQPIINGEDNPESKSAFSKRKIIEYIKNCVLSYESSSQATAARATIKDDLTQNVIIT